MKNKFKIINSENEIGVVERIIGYDYRVIFNLETIHEELAQYDLAEIENLINSGSWKVLSDYNNFDILPKEFKFIVGSDGHVFTYRENDEEHNNVFWQEEPYGVVVEIGTYYLPSQIKQFLKETHWLMLEDGLVLQDTWTEAVTCYQSYAEVNHEGYDLLQTIKQFVEEFDAQVEVCKKGYRIYSDNETIDPYRANSDEELKEILQAIRVLKKYEGV